MIFKTVLGIAIISFSALGAVDLQLASKAPRCNEASAKAATGEEVILSARAKLIVRTKDEVKQINAEELTGSEEILTSLAPITNEKDSATDCWDPLEVTTVGADRAIDATHINFFFKRPDQLISQVAVALNSTEVYGTKAGKPEWIESSAVDLQSELYEGNSPKGERSYITPVRISRPYQPASNRAGGYYSIKLKTVGWFYLLSNRDLDFRTLVRTKAK